MYENARLFFNIVWFASVGATFASALAVLISWGGYWEYLVGSLVALVISTAGSVITSL